MAEAFVEKLAALEARYVELEASLAREEVYSDPQRMLTVQRELGSQRRVVEAYRRYRQISQSIDEAEEIVSAGEDDELVEMARADLEDLRPRQEEAREEIREMLAADDEESHRDAILEIRAGTGGDEATLFAADLMRMYMRLAERRGWKVEEISMSRSEVGGIKEAVLELTGGRVYGELRFEGGVHRVQRVPATEAQGRIHTSTATVAVLPEAEEVEVELKPEEVRWEAFRASGAGGQHVNRTDSAIRMIHLPTGIKVECQDERSQHKNRVRAEKLLRAKLYQHYLEEQHARRASARKSLVGSGSRSEKIRTYNFPDSRVKDHRINFMIHDVLGMLQGGEALDEMLGALANFEKEQRLAEI